MGNVGYRFFVSFFGIALTMILFINLLFFTGLVDFGSVEHSEVYFGFSSFMNSFNSLDNFMKSYDFNGFFSFESLDTCMKGCLNSMSGGLNDVIIFGTQANGIDSFISFNFEMPALPTWYAVEGADAILDVVNNIFLALDYGIAIVRSIFTGLGFIGVLIKAFFTMLFSPIITLAYCLWMLGFILYYTFVIVSWFLLLLRGSFYSRLPNPDDVVTSQWQDVVDGWTSEWANLRAII